ncbi:MAG: tetratricopeptide repeat protein [Deltaproteobacteria bacterium]|nr:tetratricopeptide repeat protein [Deltaproteobacteria bacterium]
MRTNLAIFLIILLLLPVSAFGEILTIKHTVKQTFGGGQSPDDARISAIAKAKKQVLEKAGTYIESLTVVQNLNVDKDEILALTAGVLKAEVLSQENYHTKDAFGIEVIVNVVVNTSVLEERMKKFLQDKTHLAQLKDTQKREKELLQRVAQLEEENCKLSVNKQSSQKLEKEFQQASQGLTAVEWFYEAGALWDGGKYTDPKKAIEYLNNVIKLQPDLAEAYSNRGIAYSYLGQQRHAIENYNEAIRLKPNDAETYVNRGNAYRILSQYQRAIEDYNEAVHLKPNLAAAYYNRGKAYSYLGQKQRAIEEFNETIRLKPDDAAAYYNRGVAYADIGQKQRAIEDFNEAIRLQPDLATAYYNRGVAYADLGQYQRAIEDYNEAIRLKPNDARVYYNRGNAYDNLGQIKHAIQDYNETIRLKPNDAAAYTSRAGAYFMRGNKELFCRDVQKACASGDCKLLEMAKGKRYCR